MHATPEFPKPDRSNFQPNSYKDDDWPERDFGWQEGMLPDGRPFRVEAWERDGISMLTYFVPAEGLDLSAKEAAIRFVEETGLCHFLGEKRSCSTTKIKDASGNDMWSINVVLGERDEFYIGGFPRMQGYGQSQRPKCICPCAGEKPNPTNATNKEGDADE